PQQQIKKIAWCTGAAQDYMDEAIQLGADVFISGENIYPELVEQKLNNLAYVSESLVLERDRQLHALIYPDFETLDQEHIPEAKIPQIMEDNRQEVNKVLADFSRIVKIQIVNEPFQKTPTQKIKRYLYS
ncbi:MAG: Nif3-like dinuclear metal center hexameric protein, partial [Candidatus Cloacimonadaceae bacterium]|nr:Nif3-like dinuclear metal center hexameric protein [Candidatus Cloacimonadaceae bacterium]